MKKNAQTKKNSQMLTFKNTTQITEESILTNKETINGYVLLIYETSTTKCLGLLSK